LLSLASSVGVNVMEDVRGLVLAFKLGALSRPGEICRNEFMSGMCSLGCSTIEELQEILPSLDPMRLSTAMFKDFYRKTPCFWVLALVSLGTELFQDSVSILISKGH
jgi:hypothetical protein